MGRIVFLLVSISIYQFYLTVINADDGPVSYACAGTILNVTDNYVYQENVNSLLDNLASNSSYLDFYNSSAGEGDYKIYGLYQCRYDEGLDNCSACVGSATRKILSNCVSLFDEAIVWYYECMLWYSNSNTILTVAMTNPSALLRSDANVSNYKEFAPILANATGDVIRNAYKSRSQYAFGEKDYSSLQHLYTYAQCIPSIGPSMCHRCLQLALQEMLQFLNEGAFAVVFYPSCQLRYDTVNPILAPVPTYGPHTNALGPKNSKTTSIKPGIIAAIAILASVGLLGAAVVLWICLFRRKRKEESRNVDPASPKGQHERILQSDVESFEDMEFMQYDFNTLKTATRDFSPETKLGEGGFGIVYKGTLENGQPLAIKRLSDTSDQGTKQFMTEARFLAKLQHKNLVKLVGSCCDEDEKLLVYEFMPNSSLDRFLFDSEKRPLLDWGQRYKIVMGIARGLQYLHEDSRLTIIHRDLKPANILLDRQMNPKIADFGLARLFGVEQMLGNTTRIVGTQGYMAPEYLITGEYSEKSDVYAFGIMLLEIVSGQKNRIFNPSPRKEDLPVHVWRLWNDGRSFDITDPALYNNCSSTDVIRCIQIGLLCVQATPGERPSMTSVVLMLTGSINLPVPSSPPMSSHQFSMTNSSSVENDVDPSAAKTVTWRTELDVDLYPRPR